MEIPTDLEVGFQDPKPLAVPPSPLPPTVPDPEPEADRLARIGIDYIKQQAVQEQQLRMQRFRQAVAGDPDLQAKKVKVAQELGIDPNDNTQDWKIAEQFARQREVERQAFDARYPIVSQKMRDYDFVSQAYDDIGYLQQVESTGGWLRQNFSQGRMMVDRGYIGAMLANGYGDAELLKSQLAEIDKSMGSLPKPEGFWDSVGGGTAEVVGQMSQTLPIALGAGVTLAGAGVLAGPAAPVSSATLFTAGFLGAQGVQTAIVEGGNAYLDYIQAGMSESDAKAAASVVGVINGAVETVLGKYAVKPFTSAARKIGPRVMPKVFKPVTKQTVAASFLKEYALGVGAEVGTEIAQELSQIVGQEVGMNMSRPDLDSRWETPEGRQEIYNQIGEIASKTFYSMMLLGLPGPTANFFADARRLERVQTDSQIIKAITSGTQDSKLAQRNPELHRQFMAETKGVDEVYVTAADLRSLLGKIDEDATAKGKVQKSALDMLTEMLPDVAAQLGRAGTDQDSIVIKTEDLQAKFKDTEFISLLNPHIRIDKNGISEAEAQKYEPMVQAMSNSMKKEIGEKAKADKQFRDEIGMIRNEMRGQIQSAGRKFEEARIGAFLYTQHVALSVAQENKVRAEKGQQPITPMEWHRTYGMTVSQGVPMASNAVEAARIIEKFQVQPVVQQEPQEAAAPAPAEPVTPAPAEAAAPEVAPAPTPTANALDAAKQLLASPPEGMTQQEAGELQAFVEETENKMRSRTPATVAQMDADYLAAVQRGDMETAQRMVDDLARSLGLIEAWHGTSRGRENDGETSEGVLPFAVFRPSRIGRFGPLIYLARSREVAEQYASISVHERMNRGGGTGTRKVLRVYVSNANPIVVSEGSDQTFWSQLPEGTDAQAVAAMQRLGFTGVIADEEMAVPNPQQIKSADAITYDATGNVIPLSQRFDITKDSILFSQQPEGDIGGTYNRLTRNVVLNPDAKPTTWFHEFMHFMFDSYSSMLERGVGSEEMRADMDTLVRDLGKMAGGYAEYAAASQEDQRKVHEAVAYSWEEWLFSGETPTEGLRSIFHRIHQYFVETWKTLTRLNETYKRESGGKDLPGMTPEVREVFKRMVAATDQIKLAEATRAAVPLFLTREQWVQYGGNADDWDEYQRIERLRLDEAAASLGRKSLRSLGWLTKQHHSKLDAIRKLAEGIRAGMFDEVAASVDRTKVERARRFLATGEMMAEDGTISDEKVKVHKLTIEATALDRGQATEIMQPLDDAVAAAEAEQNGWESTPLLDLPLEPVKPAKPKPLPPGGSPERAAYDAAREEYRQASIAYAQEKARVKAENQKIRENRERTSKAVTEAKRNQRGGLDKIAEMKRKARDAHPLASLLAEDGMSPQVVAGMFGYESGEALMQDLMTAPKREDAIISAIDSKMLAENSELVTPQQMEEAVNSSLVNDFNTRWLAMELTALERAQRGGANTQQDLRDQQDAKDALIDLGNELKVLESQLRDAEKAQDPTRIQHLKDEINGLRRDMAATSKVAAGVLPARIMLASARAAARLATSTKTLRELRPDLHVVAARRHSREALQHLTDNKLQDAVNSKRQQLLSDQMAREADDIRVEVQSFMRWAQRILKRKDRKDRSLDYVIAARAVLALFGVGTKAQVQRATESAQEFLLKLKEYEPEKFDEINRIIVTATQNRKEFKDLTVEEFRRLKGLVQELWNYSKLDKRVMLDNKAVEVAEVEAQIEARAATLAKPGARPGQERRVTPLEAANNWIRSRIAWMRRAESLFDQWDGREPGVFTKVFWRPLKNAIAAYREKRDQFHKEFNAILEEIRPHLLWEPIHSPTLNYTFSDTAELLGFMMHMGNVSNASKLIAAGRGANHEWGTVDPETGEVNETRAWQAINELIRDKRLTQEHVDAVQKVWDLTAKLKPLIQRVYRDKWGGFFDEVPARSFTLVFADGRTKTYAGGYVPAKVDRELVTNYADPSSLANVDQEFKDSMPTTGWGFTIKRFEDYRKPLDMDLSRIAQHIEHTMRFVNLQPQLWAVSRLLKSEKIKTAINSIDPFALNDVIYPWLSRVASQRTGSPSGNSGMDRFLRTARNRAGMMVMFGNVSNTLQQLTGFFPALLKVKKSYLISALYRSLNKAGRNQMAEFVASKSKTMDQRLRSQIFVLQEHMNEILLNPSKFQKAQQFFIKNAYILQAAVQNRMDTIIWTAAYEEALASMKGMSEMEMEAEAIARADAAVTLTQGSTQPESISAAESGPEALRLFTQFTNYFNMLFNLNAAEFLKVFREFGFKGGAPKLAYTYAMGFLVPMVTASVIARAMAGKLDDEDDDGYWDEAGSIMVDALGRGSLSMIPIAGQMIAAGTINRWDEVTYNDRMLSNPAIGAIEKALGGSWQLLDALGDEADVTKRKVRDALVLFDMAAGIPVSQLFGKVAYGVEALTGAQPNYNVADALRGTVTGVPSEGMRQR